MASVGGRGFIGATNVAYAARKGAVIAMTKTAAQQLGRYNIHVNEICPGITFESMVKKVLEDRAAETGARVEAVREKAATLIPLGRDYEPEDVAGMAVFLASSAGRNITGQAYNVDGGVVPS